MDQEKKAGINIGGGQVNVVGDMVGGNKYVQEAPVPVVPALHQLPPPPPRFYWTQPGAARLDRVGH
jgi:hypothetical protein